MTRSLTDAEWKALVLDHYKKPRHFGVLEGATFQAEQHNRTCGDWVKVYASPVGPDQSQLNFQFTGQGCSLSMASASLMCELLKGSDQKAATRVLEHFQKVRAEGATADEAEAWQVLSGLRQYPVRYRCVCLAWQALEQILKGETHE